MPKDKKIRLLPLLDIIERWIYAHGWWAAAIAVAFIPVIVFFVYYGGWALSFDMKQVTRMPETSIIYDRNGYVMQRLFEEHRVAVTREDIPDVVRQAFIAEEDKRFYAHMGFDPVAILRAALGNFVGAKVTSGASTITQQLARNSAQMFQQTIDRKIREIFLSVRIELNFSKEEIMTLYLNRIFFGREIYGIGAASESYFGKNVKDLTLSEAAMLAGIISGPNYFSPWRNYERAEQARAKTLDRMEEQGFITKAQCEAAKNEPLVLRPLVDLPASHAISAILDELPEHVSADLIFTGGLKIYSTLDLSFQQTAERELEKTLQTIENSSGYQHTSRAKWLKSGDRKKPDYLQGAFIALDNKDGGVLAMVGGRNYQESTFNRVLNAPRPVGSTMKPFVYSNLFLNQSVTAFSEINHQQFDLHNPASEAESGEDWITIRRAVETSDNFAAMRAGLAGGIEPFVALVKRATGREIPAFPSSFLGACSQTPLDMAKAYSIFPNKGILNHPYIISRIESKQGDILYENTPIRATIMPGEVAFQIHDILLGVVNNGTARALRSTYGLEGEIGGKTGTTDEYKDAWFMGYTSAVTAGVWVGFDKPQTIRAAAYASQVAVPVWGSVMKLANAHYPPEKIIPPAGVKLVQYARKQDWGLFKNRTVTSETEYVRDDQRENSVERVHIGGAVAVVPEAPQENTTPEEKPKKKGDWWSGIQRLFTDDDDDDAKAKPESKKSEFIDVPQPQQVQ